MRWKEQFDRVIADYQIVSVGWYEEPGQSGMTDHNITWMPGLDVLWVDFFRDLGIGYVEVYRNERVEVVAHMAIKTEAGIFFYSVTMKFRS